MSLSRHPSRVSCRTPPHTSPGGHRTGGFTLMEVLVTILITGLLMVAVTEVLNSTRITRDSIHNHQEKMLVGPAILDRIEADLRGLNVFNRPPAATLRVENRVMAGLDGDSLDFVTSQDSLIAEEVRGRWLRADMTEVGYRLRPNPDDNDFLEIYRRESFGIDEEPFEGGSFTFLHDRIVAFDVQVFADDGPDAEPEDEWNHGREGRDLPRRLEITLEIEMAPRLVREQIRHLAESRRRVVYKRIVRLPQSLLLAQNVQPVPFVPVLEPPSPDEDAALGGGDDGLVDPDAPDGGFGSRPDAGGGNAGGGGLPPLGGGGGGL